MLHNGIICYATAINNFFYFLESQDWTSGLTLDSLTKLPIYNSLMVRLEVAFILKSLSFFCTIKA